MTTDRAKRRQERLDRLAAISKIGQDAASPPEPPVLVVPQETSKPPVGIEQALKELKADKAARAEWAAGRAAEQERLAPMWAEIESLPQHERRRVLDAMGMRNHSAAPPCIEPLRGDGPMPRLHKAPEPQEAAGLAKPAPVLEQGPKKGAEVTQAAPAKGRTGTLPGWTLNKPKRCDGLATPIYRVLKAAHDAGAARPNAREVLESFRQSKPTEIARVLADGCDFFDAKGSDKSADLEAIRKRIQTMTAT